MWAKHKKNGFTIVELLVVIVVIGILAAISIVAYGGIQQRAVATSLTSDLDNASKLLKLFQVDNSAFPATINCAIADSATNKCIKASSGNAYVYQSNNTSNPQDFSLTESHSNQVYSISQDGSVASGGRNLLANSSIEKTTTTSNEFTQYADLAPIFDSWGITQYTISFDIKSANIASNSNVQVYMQNGSGARYTFGVNVPVTTSYTRKSVTITPVLANASLTQSILAFYGTYGTGNISTIKNVKVEFGNTATDWTPSL